MQQTQCNYNIVLFLSFMKGAAASCLNRADVACQCNLVVMHDAGLQCRLPMIRMRTVGTQLSQCRLIYRKSLGMRLSNDWWLLSVWECLLMCQITLYCIQSVVCVFITGVQTKLPTTGAGVGTAQMRPAEQSVRGLILSSQKPTLFPPTDWSQPEIEDDQCATVVTYPLLHVSFSWRNQVMLLWQYCRNGCERDWILTESSFLDENTAVD